MPHSGGRTGGLTALHSKLTSSLAPADEGIVIGDDENKRSAVMRQDEFYMQRVKSQIIAVPRKSLPPPRIDH